MRLSGIDPGIIRELSGIYKPFVKAFKELVSNAYDADATEIFVTLSEDFSSMDVLDNGIGMTPFNFHESFARLGASTAWLQEGTSPGGRPRIGYKGIGFLAVARYCSALQVESHSRTPYTGQETVRRRNRKTIPLRDVVGEIVPTALLENRLKIVAVRVLSDSKRTRLRLKRDYVIDSKGVRLVSARSRKDSHLQFDYSVNCKGLHLRAVLDFDYLLGLERKADLRLLDNFCTVELTERSPQDKAYTRVRLHQLKDFVLRDLSGPRIKGKARNVVSKSGKEQFLWRLARTAPIMNKIPEDIRCEPVRRLNKLQTRAGLPDVIVKWRNEDPVTLKRPVYLANGQRTPLDEGVVPITTVRLTTHGRAATDCSSISYDCFSLAAI